MPMIGIERGKNKLPCVIGALTFLEDKQELIEIIEISENDKEILYTANKDIIELEKILKYIKEKGQSEEIYSTIFEGHFDNFSYNLNIFDGFLFKYKSTIGSIQNFIDFYKISLKYFITGSNIGIGLDYIDRKIHDMFNELTLGPTMYNRHT